MKNIKKFFDILIPILYIVMGCLFLLYKDLFSQITPAFQNIFGIILILYGIYRASQVYNKYYVNKEDENI